MLTEKLTKVLVTGHINPVAVHDVELNGRKRTVTALGHRVGSIVAAFDTAILEGTESAPALVDTLMANELVKARRQHAPNRKSEVDKLSLIDSLNKHVAWITGEKTARKRFVKQFTDSFGPQALTIALHIQAAFREWQELEWKPKTSEMVKTIKSGNITVTEQIPPALLEPTGQAPVALLEAPRSPESENVSASPEETKRPTKRIRKSKAAKTKEMDAKGVAQPE